MQTTQSGAPELGNRAGVRVAVPGRRPVVSAGSVARGLTVRAEGRVRHPLHDVLGNAHGLAPPVDRVERRAAVSGGRRAAHALPTSSRTYWGSANEPVWISGL